MQLRLTVIILLIFLSETIYSQCYKCTGENITINDPSCGGGSGGAFTVNITDPNDSTYVDVSFPWVNVGINGNYTITCIDSVCGEQSAIVQVFIENYPTANAGADVTDCSGNDYVIDGSASGSTGPYTYSWTTYGGGNIVSGATSEDVTVNTDGDYILVATSANGCVSPPDTVSIMFYDSILLTPSCS